MTAEIIQFHNFTVEKVSVQAKTINQNVENMTQNIAKQVNNYGKKSYGKVPRLLPEHGGLTDSHIGQSRLNFNH
ncbi:MAG: hypothetical protein NTW85_00405 [Methylococcales bacterium]|nr:hypothetical protein [Methylococcales bacterium]